MKQVKQNFYGKRIGYPMIGSGLAGGDWDQIKDIIEEELKDEDHTLVRLRPVGKKVSKTHASKSKKQYVLVIIDYCTRYPEAMAIKDIEHKRRIQELTFVWRCWQRYWCCSYLQASKSPPSQKRNTSTRSFLPCRSRCDHPIFLPDRRTKQYCSARDSTLLRFPYRHQKTAVSQTSGFQDNHPFSPPWRDRHQSRFESESGFQ